VIHATGRGETIYHSKQSGRGSYAAHEGGTTARLGYVPALDGLRGLAVLLVVAFHYMGAPLGGPYGVDLFFVLSGFLITTLLLEDREARGRVGLAGFYVRRARRLFPALAVLLAAYVAYNAALGRDAVATAADHGLYFGNIYFVVTHRADSGLGHLWSLAEEEQFYLVWPLLLILIARARRPVYWVAALLLCLVAYRGFLILDGASMTRLYRAPDTHSEGLVLGAGLALLRQRGFVAGEWAGKLGIALVVPPVVAGIWSVGLPVFELGAFFLIAAAIGKTEIAGWLSTRPLVWIGTLSYSLYLWHVPVLWAFDRHDRAIALIVSFILAWLSYRYVERPFRRRRRGVPATVSATTFSSQVEASAAPLD
jgi:peptidoglycan/LPS O-acetylase OafA/YrhL